MKLKKKPREKMVQTDSDATRAAFDVDSFVETLNTKYGVGSMFRASEALGLRIQHLPTGCHRLDFALGGGWPKSRMIELYGGESAGKSTLLYSTIAQFQKAHPRGLAAVIDFERSFDPNYVEYLGVDISRLFVVNPDDGEQGADMLNDLVQAKTDIFLGVDSIAAMTPTSTLEVSAEKAEVGVHPRLVNRVMAKCNARMKRNLIDADYPTTTVIFTNQEREKVGVMFGDPTTTPGGKGKNFFTSIRVKLFSSGSTKNKIIVPKVVSGQTKDILVGRVVSFTIVKNKCGGTPFEDGEYKYFIKPHKGYPAWCFDNEDALFEYGVFHEIIKLVFKKGDKGGTYTYDSISTKMQHIFVQELRENPEIAEALYGEIMEAVKLFNSGKEATAPDQDDEKVDDGVEEVEEVE